MPASLSHTLNQEITKSFSFKFLADTDGIYLIEIIAITKSWPQNLKGLKSFFKADKLAVKIDEFSFSKQRPNSKQHLKSKSYSGAMDYNGNQLKGQTKEFNKKLNLKEGLHYKVRLPDQPNTIGYIYTEALEIQGEDPKTIEELIIKKAKELDEDSCLILSIAKRESRLFPYAVSSKGARGLFQLMDPAVLHVNQTYSKRFTNRFDVQQSIEIGILYFKIIKKRYEGKSDFLEKCLAAWNWGMDNIDANKPIIIKNLPIETQRFIKEVIDKYKNCQQNIKVDQNGKSLVLAILLFGAITFFTSIMIPVIFYLRAEMFPLPTVYADYTVLADKLIDIDKDGQPEKLAVISNIPTQYTFGSARTILIRQGGSYVEIANGGADWQWWQIGDFNHNGKIELAVLYGYSGSAGFGQFDIYEFINNGFVVLFSKEDVANDAKLVDINNDKIKEIVYSYQPVKWAKEEQVIYYWDKEKMVYKI